MQKHLWFRLLLSMCSPQRLLSKGRAPFLFPLKEKRGRNFRSARGLDGDPWKEHALSLVCAPNTVAGIWILSLWFSPLLLAFAAFLQLAEQTQAFHTGGGVRGAKGKTGLAIG